MNNTPEFLLTFPYWKITAFMRDRNMCQVDANMADIVKIRISDTDIYRNCDNTGGPQLADIFL